MGPENVIGSANFSTSTPVKTSDLVEKTYQRKADEISFSIISATGNKLI